MGKNMWFISIMYVGRFNWKAFNKQILKKM